MRTEHLPSLTAPERMRLFHALQAQMGPDELELCRLRHAVQQESEEAMRLYRAAMEGLPS